jgi:heat shock protein HslJ
MRAKRLALVLAGSVVLVVATAVAGGCGSGSGGDGGSGSPGGGGSTSAASLAGTSWRLTGWSVSSQDPNDFTITAEFKDGRIGGTSAVNQYGGSYTAGDDGSFSVGELISTMMAGPEPDMKAERTYLDLLNGARAFRMDGDTLTLSDAQGNDSLIYSRDKASPSP